MLKLAHGLSALGLGLLLAPALFARGPDASTAIPLGVQTCDTQCQSVETDCDLACDQVASCVDECKKASEVCVQKCHDAPPDAPATKPDAPAKPTGPAAKKAPAKKAAAKGKSDKK